MSKDAFGQILAERGGHKVISSGTAYTNTDYHFWGFIPHEDVTISNLKIGTTNVTPTGITFKAGIYYGAPYLSAAFRGWYTEITLASGSAVLILTRESPTKY
jgi:hypothetical protein